MYEGVSRSDESNKQIVAEIFPDFDALKLHNIENVQAYFEEEIKKVNAKNVSYKAVTKIKIRNEEFIKNTSRKIMRFKIDKTFD